MGSWLFLGLILGVSLLSKNNSLIIASLIVMVIKLFPFASKWFNLIENKGLNWGIIMISIAILTPIATGKIGFQDLIEVFKTPAGWVAVSCGALVSILSKWGVGQLSFTPQITVALMFGTIMGIVLLKGIAAGPIIASGITYVIISLLHLSF